MLSIVVSVMHLISSWLRNEHVVFAADDLAEMRKFIIYVGQLRTLDELVREVAQGIDEKVRTLVVLCQSHAVNKFEGIVVELSTLADYPVI